MISGIIVTYCVMALFTAVGAVAAFSDVKKLNDTQLISVVATLAVLWPLTLFGAIFYGLLSLWNLRGNFPL